VAEKLPKWLTVRPDGVAVVDPDKAYPIVLKALGVADKDVDQYYVETAYQCAKMAAQDLLGQQGAVLQIRIECRPKWALKNFPVGRGIVLATKGREAKALYGKVVRALMTA